MELFLHLTEMNAGFTEDHRIYKLGGILGEYIAASRSMENFRELIRSNGNIPETLELSVPEFESNWYLWMNERYNF